MTQTKLDNRAGDILRRVVEVYVETGGPAGSRTLSKQMGHSLSAASIRNSLADLEELGFLYSPHASAGRLPTVQGLRWFVDGLLEYRESVVEVDIARALSSIERQAESMNPASLLEEASQIMSGLSRCAGIVVAPKEDLRLRQIEFVALGPNRVLVVLVSERGQVENRIIEWTGTISASVLQIANNYFAARLSLGRVGELRAQLEEELERDRNQIDQISAKLVAAGLATLSERPHEPVLIVRGHANLLEHVDVGEDLMRVRTMMEAMERSETAIRLLEAAQSAEGINIFIGAESDLFARSGASGIVAPLYDQGSKVVGAVGVIGPTRMNYARIIPLVDQTAAVLQRLLDPEVVSRRSFSAPSHGPRMTPTRT